MKFETSILPEYTLIEIKLDEGEILKPEILGELEPPQVDPKIGVVVSGRAPIWLYGFLSHHYHPVAWFASADPRLGYVVTATHSTLQKVGNCLGPNAPIIV